MVKSIFEDDKWGDDDAFDEHKRIMAIISGVVASMRSQQTQTARKKLGTDDQ
jgi:hypothetical protein